MTEPTTEDLHKAIGAFMIALGASMPGQLAERIANGLNEIGLQTERNGEPTVGKLCQDFADAVMTPHTNDQKTPVQH